MTLNYSKYQLSKNFQTWPRNSKSELTVFSFILCYGDAMLHCTVQSFQIFSAAPKSEKHGQLHSFLGNVSHWKLILIQPVQYWDLELNALSWPLYEVQDVVLVKKSCMGITKGQWFWTHDLTPPILVEGSAISARDHCPKTNSNGGCIVQLKISFSGE